MLRNLELRPCYNSYQMDLATKFFDPVLKEGMKYDRAAAYFSAKALSIYSKGLNVFARKPYSHFRLLISTEISEEDYNAMKQGYDLRKDLRENMLSRLREQITLEEGKALSNLAHLISLGVVDVKIAFTKRGIFHDKFGIITDETGDEILFKGSNNETTAAIEHNFESFDLTCSWHSSEFCISKIKENKNMFEQLWNGEFNGVITKKLDDTVYDEIQKFRKNDKIEPSGSIAQSDICLDYRDNTLVLDSKEGIIEDLISSPFYKLRLKMYIETVTPNIIYFKNELNTHEFKKIRDMVKDRSTDKGWSFSMSTELDEYIQRKEFHIHSRSRVGAELKQRGPRYFDKFREYKDVVDRAMIRKLRDQQMWDSFFMCGMEKSGNFSVPGSGKTASALGMYAYLKEISNVTRIVMIGPINSFISWKHEFNACFGDNIPLDVFDCQDPENQRNGIYNLKMNSGNKNLFLFNYEGLGKYKNVLKENIIDDRTIVILDEVHRVKNPDGVYAGNVRDIVKDAGYMVTMTGTPIPNSYLDLYNLLQFLFSNDYSEFFGFTEDELKRPTTSMRETINNSIYPFFCRTTKDQLGVPLANEDIMECVCATDAENELFKAIVSRYRDCPFALIIRLMQMESDPKMLLNTLDVEELTDAEFVEGQLPISFFDPMKGLDREIKAIGITSKTKACVDLIKRLVGEGRKVILWTIFKGTINNLKRILTKEGIDIREIHGGIGKEERAKTINDFREGKFDLLITNPHTLAESVSLHSACHDAIYFEYSYNLVHLLQSKDRIHRLGLEPGQYTQYYYLQSMFDNGKKEFSPGAEIYERLHEKERIMLDAIDKEILEIQPSSEEDLEAIFSKLELY